MQTGIDARECELCRVGLGRETAGKLDHVGDRVLGANFVDRGSVNLAVDGDRWPDGWNEDDVPRQQLGIVGRVAANQHVVEIQSAHELAPSPELDVAQRTNRLGPARGE